MEDKIKLIQLILICNFVKAKKGGINTPSQAIELANDNIFWLKELYKQRAAMKAID